MEVRGRSECGQITSPGPGLGPPRGRASGLRFDAGVGRRAPCSEPTPVTVGLRLGVVGVEGPFGVLPPPQSRGAGPWTTPIVPHRGRWFSNLPGFSLSDPRPFGGTNTPLMIVLRPPTNRGNHRTPLTVTSAPDSGGMMWERGGLARSPSGVVVTDLSLPFSGGTVGGR